MEWRELERLGSLASRILEAITREEELGGCRPAALASHSLRVARLSAMIASMEGGDPRVAFVAGLLHDYGKIRSRATGADEDRLSAEEARRILESLGEYSLASAVHRALTDPESLEYKAVRDADALAKAGSIGILVNLAGWLLRGLNVEEALLERLPMELSWSTSLRASMETRAGKTLADRLAERSLSIALWMLDELRMTGLDLEVERVSLEGREVPVIKPSRCPRCGSTSIAIRVQLVEGAKCRNAVATHKCTSCGWRVEQRVCID